MAVAVVSLARILGFSLFMGLLTVFLAWFFFYLFTGRNIFDLKD